MDSVNRIIWDELMKMEGCWWSELCDGCDERSMSFTVLISVQLLIILGAGGDWKG